MNAIEVKNLNVSYDPKKLILENMNLAIPQGKITVIIGANGCGKSTLLKTIARTILAKSGEIYIHGDNIKKMKAKEIAKQVAFLPQNPQAPEGLKVRELVTYGRFPYQTPFSGLNKQDEQIVDAAQRDTGIDSFADKYLENLSGGQKQRAWIAMILAQETDILLLDEPTTYLDMAYQLEVLLLLQRLNKEKQKTIVLVLHEINHACRFADYIIGMKKGVLSFEGQVNDVITKQNLHEIYGVSVDLEQSKHGHYPVIVDYNFS